MAQAREGTKMLHDPTVCVDDKIYFTGELLQRASGQYFILERFFVRKRVDDATVDGNEELHALGWEVDRSDVHTPTSRSSHI
jgi:hypothetical protein